MLNTIIIILALYVAWTFKGPVLALVTQALGMVSKTMSVGEKHLDSWAEDAELSAKINSERKKQQLKTELDQVNAKRVESGKAPLEMPE